MTLVAFIWKCQVHNLYGFWVQEIQGRKPVVVVVVDVECGSWDFHAEIRLRLTMMTSEIHGPRGRAAAVEWLEANYLATSNCSICTQAGIMIPS